MQFQIQRSFHSNGSIRTEVSYENGRRNGLSRTYHTNGQVVEEVRFCNNLLHGVCKSWAVDGRFLGEYRMKHGTGTVIMWYDTGKIQAEVSFVDGLITGRQKSWDEAGEPFSTLFWIRGKKVPKSKYMDACRTDQSLPKYE